MYLASTPPKFNMEPENGTQEQEIPFKKTSFLDYMLNLGSVTINSLMFFELVVDYSPPPYVSSFT